MSHTFDAPSQTTSKDGITAGAGVSTTVPIQARYWSTRPYGAIYVPRGMAVLLYAPGTTVTWRSPLVSDVDMLDKLALLADYAAPQSPVRLEKRKSILEDKPSDEGNMVITKAYSPTMRRILASRMRGSENGMDLPVLSGEKLAFPSG